MNKDELHVIYGNNPFEMVKEILSTLKIEEEIRPDMLIGIKPNLVVARPAEEGATTHPEIVEGVISYLKSKGLNNIIILEGSWVGDSTKLAYDLCGYEEISKRYNVPLYDLKDDSYEVKKAGDMDIKVCRKALEVDYLINMPVLKAHCQTLFTCSLKNLKGCLPDSEKRRFHSLGLNRPIGHLSMVLKPSLIIVDAICGDLTFEEGGNPVNMDRIILGKDPVLTDTYGASLIGYSKDDIEYIKIAEDQGVGSSDISKARIYEHNINLKVSSRFKASGKVKRLTEKVNAKDACSACFGSLVHTLQRMDEKGELKKLKEKIYIGQGFRGESQDGIGIGNCTSKFGKHVKGCPPTAKDIMEYIEDQI
jgi:uncharacterized protein (DUF362 family)